MSKKRKNKSIIFVVMLLALISVGYATISTSLNINGFTNIKGNSWDVHFENVKVTEGSVEAITVPTSNNVDTTEITYKVALNAPGDFYEFTVDAVNKGTIDAMVGNNPTLQVDNHDLDEVLLYDVTYTNGMKIINGDLLKAQTGKAYYKVRVEYKEDIKSNQLVDTNTEIKLSFNSTYVQAQEKEVLTTFSTDSWETIIDNVQNQNKTYEVGSTKEVNLGTYGTHTLRVANNTIPDICSTPDFSQTACGFVLEFTDVITIHIMNPSGEYKGNNYSYGWNVDGWPSTTMYDLLNDIDNPDSIINELSNSIDSNKILNTYAITGHGNTSSEQNFITNDKLYLLSTHEVWIDGENKPISIYDSAYNATRQLDYYETYVNADGTSGTSTDLSKSSSAIKLNSDVVNYYWWLRTARSSNTNGFISVTSEGTWVNSLAFGSNGVSPAFRLA